MPELAEVEIARRTIDKYAKNQTIKEVTVDPDDKFFFAFARPNEVRKALIGATVTGSGRKGKYFWLELNKKPWPIFHLGMTGSVSICSSKTKKTGEKLWHGVQVWKGKDRNEPKRLWFSRIEIEFKNGDQVAILDPRRFGRMWLTQEPLKEPRISRLGSDPLQDFLTGDDLATRLKKRSGPIKAVLLDQKLFAGVGNWLADEILYQAKISPHRIASKLTTAEIKKLRSTIVGVCEKAVHMNANYELFPKSWLFHTRWGKSKTATVAGKKITHDEVGGRTTAWVPGVQK